MIKKYQVHMSLEWMFAMAVVGAYIPAFQKAFADRKVMLVAQERQRRQEELEVFFVAHGPSDVPKQAWMYNSTTWVGATDSTFNKSDIRIGSAEKIIKAQRLVNKEFREAKGDGSHYGIFSRVVP